MIRGQDAHGGNVQSENPVIHHDDVKCDHCQNDVIGIRFDCVHCPSLTFCEKYEQQTTLNHSTENQFLQQQQQHVFKFIMVPQEEAN
ncbi:unnamed protein product [Rotaria sp. Silwood2]|nr:unnamed protein product [Rotaria sp. Silwood2]